jgi:hypothetical protein
MNERTTWSRPPYLIAGATTAVAVAFLVAGWAVLLSQPRAGIGLPTMLLALCLMVTLVAGSHFPIHLRVASKVHMGTVVLFLMASLLPPALAATVAALGLLAAELSVQHRTSNPLHASLTQASRLTVIVFMGSLLATTTVFGTGIAVDTGLQIAAAVWMLAADALTFPLVYCPATGDRPRKAIMLILRDGGIVEGAQYLVGLLGYFETSHGYWTLGLLFLPTMLVYIAFKNTKEMHDETRRILENMADAVDLRDPYTGGHSRRVTEFTQATLRELGKYGAEVRLIVSAARVHDIGKIAIPDDVLKKESRLTEAEWAIMKTHPERGAELLAKYPDFLQGVSIIRHHHERWDGDGYPHRLAASDIPFGARVIAVCDSYDAMTSDRPYRRGMSPDQAAEILREGRGQQWDPQVVDAFLRTIADRLCEQPSRPHLHIVQPEPEGAIASLA